MKKITTVILLLIFVALPLSYAAGDFAYNRLCASEIDVNIISPIEENGGIPINLQDQTTRPFDVRVAQFSDTHYYLDGNTTIGSYNILLNDSTGLSIGDGFSIIYENDNIEIYIGYILDITGNLLTMDVQIPYNFSEDARPILFNSELGVDGSTDPEIFAVTNFFDNEIDVTRFIFHCTDNAVMDNEKFCGLNALTRGITLRKKSADGTYSNYWNVKTNGEWGELAYDKSYDDKAPSGYYGFSSRLTYAGQDKHGVTIRLAQGESIELLVQDDLTGLETGRLMVQGHFVQS